MKRQSTGSSNIDKEQPKKPKIEAYSPTASPIAADTSSASVFGAYYRPKDKDKEFEESSKNDNNDNQIKPRLEPLTPWLTGCRSVDNYRRLNSVEEGTYGVVYRAKDIQTGEIVALKKVKMLKEMEGFPITSLREVKLLMAHKHPNVVDVKEIVVGQSLDSIFIVMEFLEHDLRALMEEMKPDTRFLTSEVKCLMLQLLSGVAHLHDNWILHRDLKTSNLLYNHHGILKLADFGLAREYGSPLKEYTHLVVTLWYRAPELLLGAKTYSTAIDMWSVGCIFAELITKESLLPGKGELDQLDKMFKLLGTPTEKIWPGVSELPNSKKMNFPSRPYSSLRKQFPMITEAGYDLLNRMLCYDPSKRITAQEALQHRYFQESPVAKEPQFMPSWPSSHEGKKKKVPSLDEEEKMRMLAANETERFASTKDRSYGFKLQY